MSVSRYCGLSKRATLQLLAQTTQSFARLPSAESVGHTRHLALMNFIDRQST